MLIESGDTVEHIHTPGSRGRVLAIHKRTCEVRWNARRPVPERNLALAQYDQHDKKHV